ncbi:hypothetical protein Droror1_Dr00017809 [Drosera rotundifolia]
MDGLNIVLREICFPVFDFGKIEAEVGVEILPVAARADSVADLEIYFVKDFDPPSLQSLSPPTVVASPTPHQIPQSPEPINPHSEQPPTRHLSLPRHLFISGIGATVVASPRDFIISDNYIININKKKPN